VVHSSQVYASLAKIPQEKMTPLLDEEQYRQLVQWLKTSRDAKQVVIQEDVGTN
jgi:hypothetical protein